jgi:hypothetical protein
MELPKPHPGKNIIIEFDGLKVERYPVRTELILKGADLVDIVTKAVNQYIPLLAGKKIFIAVGEKSVASSQGRAFLIKDIKPSKLAVFLSDHVTKTPVGIGLGSPWTMEIALRDVGLPRILFAAFIGAITKPFGIKGMFYRVAGQRARSVDGPVEHNLPPFNECAVLGAINASETAEKISQRLGELSGEPNVSGIPSNIPVAIVDANDIGVNVIGITKNGEPLFFKKVFGDNPLGQTNEQTPIALIAY